MKTSITVFIFLLAAVVFLPASAQMIERTDAIWARTVPEGTITMDGVLDEEAWSKADSIVIQYGVDAGMPNSGWRSEGGELAPDSTYAVLKFLVEGDYLYMAAVVKDKSIGGSSDWARWDALLMNIPDRSVANRPTPPVEYFYAWWDTLGSPTLEPGGKPKFLGWRADRDNPDHVETWDAVTTVQGLSNDDSVTDTSWTVEMRWNLSMEGYDVKNPEGEIVEFNISIWDADWLWPQDGDNFSSTRVWWQNPWGNVNGHNKARIHVRPDVGIDTDPVPAIAAEALIPNAQDFDPPVIDGSLDDEVWAHAPGFDIRYGDDALRASYTTIGPYRSGQFQPELDEARAPVLDPGDATIKWFFIEDTLYIGVDVRDEVVSSSDVFDLWDGIRIIISDRGSTDEDNMLASRHLTVRVGENGDPVLVEYLPFLVDSLKGARVGLALKDNTVVDDPSAPDEGYTIEIAIDLTKLGYPSGRGDGVVFLGMTLFDGDVMENPEDTYGTRTWWFREHGGIAAAAWVYMDPSYILTSVPGDPSITVPDRFVLMGNYPNPFNPSTTIQYMLPEAGYVTVDVFDVLGRSVKSIDVGLQTPGEQRALFSPVNLSSGVYLYRVSVEYQGSGKKSSSHFGRMVYLK